MGCIYRYGVFMTVEHMSAKEKKKRRFRDSCVC